MGVIELLVISFMFLLAIYTCLTAYKAYLKMAISNRSWELRLRVARIEHLIYSDYPNDDSAKSFAQFLADVCTDEQLMIHINSEALTSKEEGEKIPIESMVAKYGEASELIKESLSAAAEASYLMGRHSFLRPSNIDDQAIRAQKQVLLKESAEVDSIPLPSSLNHLSAMSNAQLITA